MGVRCAGRHSGEPVVLRASHRVQGIGRREGRSGVPRGAARRGAQGFRVHRSAGPYGPEGGGRAEPVLHHGGTHPVRHTVRTGPYVTGPAPTSPPAARTSLLRNRPPSARRTPPDARCPASAPATPSRPARRTLRAAAPVGGVEGTGVRPVRVERGVLAVHLLGDDDLAPGRPGEVHAAHVIRSDPRRPGQMRGPRIVRTHDSAPVTTCSPTGHRRSGGARATTGYQGMASGDRPAAGGGQSTLGLVFPGSPHLFMCDISRVGVKPWHGRANAGHAWLIKGVIARFRWFPCGNAANSRHHRVESLSRCVVLVVNESFR